MIGASQFTILTILAMIFYGGGTLNDPSSKYYSFFENYFSDLGRVNNHLGSSNLISYILFSIALIAIGLLSIPLFISGPLIMEKKSISQKLSVIGSITGIFSAICYIGIAFTPYDVLGGAHIIFVILAFGSAFYMVLFYIPAFILNKDFPNRYVLTLIIFEIILASYIGLIFFGPSSDTLEGLLIQATGQKIVVYSEIITLFIVGYTTWKIQKS